MSTMIITSAGGVAVEAAYKGHVIRTDQPASAGGSDSAPSPFDLFLASIGTCMGFYAVRFCQERNLSTDGLRITLDPLKNELTKHIDMIRVRFELPREFPEKYRTAIERTIDRCAVKKHLADPPRFEVVLRDGAATTAA